jgi:hypothetical protein
MLIEIVDITKKHTTNVQKQDIQLLKAKNRGTNKKYNKLTINNIITKHTKSLTNYIYHLNCSLKIITTPLLCYPAGCLTMVISSTFRVGPGNLTFHRPGQ